MDLRLDVYIHFSQEKEILVKLERLETQMSKADDAITDLGTAFSDFTSKMTAAMDNIVADEQAILAKLNALPAGELSPASEATIQGIKDTLTTMLAREQGIAESIPEPPPPPAPPAPPAG